MMGRNRPYSSPFLSLNRIANRWKYCIIPRSDQGLFNFSYLFHTISHLFIPPVLPSSSPPFSSLSDYNFHTHFSLITTDLTINDILISEQIISIFFLSFFNCLSGPSCYDWQLLRGERRRGISPPFCCFPFQLRELSPFQHL